MADSPEMPDAEGEMKPGPNSTAHISGETFDLPEVSNREREAQERIIKELEVKRKARATAVPTDDAKVRQLLRELGEPVTLFGEREMERRDRLRKLLAERDQQVVVDVAGSTAVMTEIAPTQPEIFYTEGPASLRDVRIATANWSLKRAKKRLAAAKHVMEDEEARTAAVEARQRRVAQVRRLALQSSEIADERPVSCCAFAPDAASLATCGWSGLLSTWSTPGATPGTENGSAVGCKPQWSVRAHEDRCTGVAWHPHASISQGSETLALATASADCTAKLWGRGGKHLGTLAGHKDRLGRLAFHPMGQQIGLASFDGTWSLWDVESGSLLAEQEGHSRAVYSVAFHPDGSLAGSAGLDAVCRMWDCRSGRNIWTLEGHVKHVLAVDFSPNGYHVATGSEDHLCKVWDLRSRRCLYSIPAHTSLLSMVRFEPQHGNFILTSSYDNLAKLWSAQDFTLLKTLAGHEGKVMAADVSAGEELLVATVGYDRTVKYWSPEDDIQMDSLHGEDMMEMG